MMYADADGVLQARVNVDVVGLDLIGNHLIVVGKGIPIEAGSGESKRLIVFELDDEGDE